MEKKLRQFTLSNEGEVMIQFIEEVFIAGSKVSDDDEDEDADRSSANRYAVKSENKPHKDLYECMTALKKHGLAVCEIGVSGKELQTWAVSGIKIAGDVTLKKSRVQLRVSKFIKRTKKTIHMWSPQVTMYPDVEGAAEYEAADKMTEAVEALIDEVFAYLAGKYEVSGQLPLFAEREVEA